MLTSVLSAQVFFTVTMDSAGTGSTSTAKGTAFAVLSTDMSTLTYQVTYNRLSSNFTASHFHHSGGVTAIPFVGATANGNTVAGTWTNITNKNIEDLMRGTVYINVHSSNFPGGEIRGYLKPAGGITMSINLDGAQAGNINVTGRGTGWVVIDSANARIKWNATVTGLTTKLTAAHFHYAGAVHATPFTDSSSSGTWSAVPDTVIRLFLKGDAYMNVHTSTNVGGEIRGTTKNETEVFFTVAIDSAGTGSSSTAKGTAFAVLSSDVSKLTYQVTYNRLSSNYTASHFHHSGGVTAIPFVGTTANGNTVASTWANLTNKNIEDVIRGKVYINIHSATSPGGEIRGYLTTAEGIGMSIALDGAQAGIPSATGKGTGWAVIDSSSARIKWNATVTGLTSKLTAAHFHYAGTVHATPFTDSSSSGIWSAVPDTVIRLFLKAGSYMNVHTSTNTGGEIRGTVKLGNGIVTSVGSQNSSALPEKFALEQNYPNPFNPSTVIAYQLPITNRITLKVYDVIGREVATLVNEIKEAGYYSATFNASKLSSGVYFARLQSGNVVQMKKLLLVK